MFGGRSAQDQRPIKRQGPTIRGATGTPITLDTYVEAPFSLIRAQSRIPGLKPSDEVEEGKILTVVVTVFPAINEVDPDYEGGVQIKFIRLNGTEIPNLTMFKVISLNDDHATFFVPMRQIGKRSIIIIANTAIKDRNPPRKITLPDEENFIAKSIKVK